MSTSKLHKKIDQRNSNRKSPQPAGPIWIGQVLPVDVEDEEGHTYNVLFLPDKNNEHLRASGKPMRFYYLPDKPRLARHEDGSRQFHLQKFSGVMDPTKNIGEDGYSESAGGCLTFSSTLGMPKPVLDNAFEGLKKLLPTYRSIGHFKWHQEKDPEPQIASVLLHSNKTLLHSLRYGGADEGSADGTPDPWSYEIQGDGNATTHLEGANAYTVMLGSRPVQMLMGSAESGTSQITLANEIGYYVWSPVTRITVTANWKSVYDHYSHHIKGGIWMLSGDFKKVTNDLIQTDSVTVDIEFGAGMVDVDQQKKYEAAADEVASAFMSKITDIMKEAAKNAKTEAAAAESKKFNFKKLSKTFLGFTSVWGSAEFGAAFESMKNEFSGESTYEKKISKQVVRSDSLSSQMEGLFDEVEQSEEARRRYFSEVFFEEGFKKIHVVANANANWPSEDGLDGDPIHRMKLQVGYPDSRGNLTWKSAARYKNNDADTDLSSEPSLAGWTPETKDRLYVFDFTRHDNLEDAADQIHIKKTVSLREGPNVATNEVTIEEVTNDHIIEVRAESAGQLRVGPIGIDMPLGENDDQVTVHVHVRTETFDEQIFEFTSGADEEADHFFNVWYEGPEYIEPYAYKVGVVIKGRRFGQRALRWEGDWTEGTGSGPLIAEIPEIPDEIEDKIDEYLGLGEPA